MCLACPRSSLFQHTQCHESIQELPAALHVHCMGNIDMLSLAIQFGVSVQYYDLR